MELKNLPLFNFLIFTRNVTIYMTYHVFHFHVQNVTVNMTHHVLHLNAQNVTIYKTYHVFHLHSICLYVMNIARKTIC